MSVLYKFERFTIYLLYEIPHLKVLAIAAYSFSVINTKRGLTSNKWMNNC